MAKSVSHALARAAQINPHGPATITYHGPDLPPTLTTYTELRARTTRLAQALHHHYHCPSLKKGDRLAFLCRNHELFLTYLFAASDMGLVAAPLNTRWGSKEIAAALVDCEPAIVVCDADLWPLLKASLLLVHGGGGGEQGGKESGRRQQEQEQQEQQQQRQSVRGIILLYTGGNNQDNSSSPVSQQTLLPPIITHEALLRLSSSPPSSLPPSLPPSPRGHGHDIHCLIYTSGSTGEPKGVMLSHTAQMTQALEKISLGQYTPNKKTLPPSLPPSLPIPLPPYLVQRENPSSTPPLPPSLPIPLPPYLMQRENENFARQKEEKEKEEKEEEEEKERGEGRKGTIYLSLPPLFHVAGLNTSIAVTLAGGTHVFLSSPAAGATAPAPPPASSLVPQRQQIRDRSAADSSSSSSSSSSRRVPGLGTTQLALQGIKQLQVNTLVVVPTMLAGLVATQQATAAAATAAAATTTTPPPHCSSKSNNNNQDPSLLLLPSLTFVLVGGQALPPSLHLTASSLMPHARFVQSYACSEACSSITFLPLPSPRPPSLPPSLPPQGCVGQAAHPVEIGILEVFAEEGEERREEGKRMHAFPSSSSSSPPPPPPPPFSPSGPPSLPPPRSRPRVFVTEPGKIGEIATRGPHLMTGYWRRPEATAAVLIYPTLPLPLPPSLPPPASGSEGGPESQGQLYSGRRKGGREGGGPWLCTGDLGMLDQEGNLHLVGRLADVIRSGGEKIMAVEIERVLLDHPLVEGVAVVGVPDKKYGERAVAVVVLRRGKEGGREGGLGEELQAHCRRFLAGYKVPKEVVFRETLPLTGSGKVRKAVLVKELSVKAQEEEKEKRRSFL